MLYYRAMRLRRGEILGKTGAMHSWGRLVAAGSAALLLALSACGQEVDGPANSRPAIAWHALTDQEPADPLGSLEHDPGDLLARPVHVARQFTPIRIDPATHDAHRYLVSGFSGPDPTQGLRWFWSNGSSSRLVFELPEPQPIRLAFGAFPFLPAGDRPQRIDVWANRAFVETLQVRAGEAEYQVLLPAGALRPGANEIELRYEWTAVPARVLPGSVDDRELAIAYTHIEIGNARPPAPAPEHVRLETGEPALLIDRAEELSWLLWPPRNAALEIGWVALAGAVPRDEPLHVRIALESDDGSRVLTDALVRESDRIAHARLPLSLESSSLEKSQAVRIRLSVSELPAGVRFAWVEPRIEAAPSGERDRAASPPRAPAGTNLVVFLLDAATRKRFGVYGGPATTTPAIDALAAESLVFDAAFANGSYTLASMGSLFTSRLPTEHGLLEVTDRVAPGLPTLAGALTEAGYDTAVFAGNPYISMEFELARGFRDVFELFRPEHWRPEGHIAHADDFYGPVADWIGERKQHPFFAFIHYVQPHEPYNAGSPELYQLDDDYAGEVTGSQQQMIEIFKGELQLGADDIRRVEQLYTGNLRYADRAVGRLVDLLRDEGLLERTIVVVTADHGESLGERGSFGHGHTVDAELISVPLVIRLPGALNRRGRVADQVAGIDLMPTLLETLGVPVPADVRGVNFLDAPANARSGWPRSVVSVAGGRVGTVSVIAGSFKFSHERTTDRVRLLRLPEQEDGANLRWSHPVTFAYLAEEADRLRASRDTPAHPHADAVPAETVDALRALGYIDLEHEPDAEAASRPGPADPRGK